jgi:hypothetical protein
MIRGPEMALNIYEFYIQWKSVVSKVSGRMVDGRRSFPGDGRILFPHHIRTSLGAIAASYSLGLGIKRAEREADHYIHLLLRLKYINFTSKPPLFPYDVMLRQVDNVIIFRLPLFRTCWSSG